MKSTDSVVRIVKNRDSATTILRKIGLKQRDYNFFIKKLDDGSYECHAAAAKAHLDSLLNPKTDEPKTTKVVAAGTFDDLLAIAGQVKKKKSGGRNYDKPSVPLVKVCAGIGEVCKGMILAGKSNKEIWDHIRERFQLQDNKKRGYPAWYRANMKRKGELNG